MPGPNNNINLLAKDSLQKSSLGRLLVWTLGVGKHLLIFTIFVSVVTFSLRFKLDSDLSRIQEDIKQKQDTITSLEEVEYNAKFLQQRLAFIKGNDLTTLKTNEILKDLLRIMPLDLFLNELSIKDKTINLKGKALSKSGLSAFLNELQANKKYSDINLESVSSKGKEDPTLIFSLKASFNY